MANHDDEVCNPFGDILYIDISPDEPFGRFPSFFSRHHPHAVPMHALLIDPLGNPNHVDVEKIGNHTNFTDGWVHFGRSYGIEVGAQIRLVYVGVSTFEFTIRTYKGIEWIYPPIPEPLDGDGVGAGVNMADGDQQLLVANNQRFYSYLVKWVSFSEFTGDAMSIPKEFYLDALINPDSEMYIVDEYGKLWPCFLRRGISRQAETCIVTKGWARFCRRKGFQQGQKLKFVVTRAHSNQLHFIPVV